MSWEGVALNEDHERTVHERISRSQHFYLWSAAVELNIQRYGYWMESVGNGTLPFGIGVQGLEIYEIQEHAHV